MWGAKREVLEAEKSNRLWKGSRQGKVARMPQCSTLLQIAVCPEPARLKTE